ncbi:hypothetical protein [Spirochaeta lutea]|uniref:Uncharacterized protein n=1 Tax=Spirochaeta lutea TaxID=1480694 RepID=A0A098R086_9SPIO|nr:hypothetical protein [Spirochaeta lutea]KGE73309.1 hypothetical protein DC28_04720 [Spirochaeta lutea]
MKQIKKACVGFILFMILAHMVFALDPVKFEEISRFPNGSGEGEFRFHEFEGMGSNPSSPVGLVYVDEGFYITDNVNQRVVWIKDDGAWHVILTGIDREKLIATPEYLFFFGYPGRYQVYELKAGHLLSDDTFLNRFEDASFYNRAIIAGDMLVIQPYGGGSEPRYFGFHITEDFDGTISMMNPEETIRFLKEDYEGTEEFTVDEDGYIFWNRRLVAPYGYSYARYHWNTTRPTTEWQATILFSQFIGWDQNGNTYWNDHRRISVLSPGGESVAFFEATNLAESARSQFTVTPEGTLYVLSYNRDHDEFELMKLERFW